MTIRAHIARACSPLIIALSLVLIAAATVGALAKMAPEPTVWFMGHADLGLWI